MKTDQKLKLKKHSDWPVKIQITDYDSYVAGTPFKATYILAIVVYTDPIDTRECIGHNVSILRFNERFYYYNDMATEGKIRDLPPQHILDVLLSKFIVSSVIYVRK